jgi:hypothetical protein
MLSWGFKKLSYKYERTLIVGACKLLAKMQNYGWKLMRN